MSVKKRGPELPCPHLIWFCIVPIRLGACEAPSFMLSTRYGFPADDEARRLVFSPRIWIMDLGAPQRYLFSCIPRGLLDFQQQSVGTRCFSRTEKLPMRWILSLVLAYQIHTSSVFVLCLGCVNYVLNARLTQCVSRVDQGSCLWIVQIPVHLFLVGPSVSVSQQILEH